MVPTQAAAALNLESKKTFSALGLNPSRPLTLVVNAQIEKGANKTQL